MWSPLISGLSMGLFLAISVGPLLFTVIKQRLNTGIRGGFSFVAGIWLSDILFVLLSNIFTVFTAQFASNYIRLIGYCGGVLLIGLGVYYVFFKATELASMDEGPHKKIDYPQMTKLFATGFLINTLNPILFFEWLSAATIFAKTYSVSYRVLLFSTCLSVNILSDVLKVMLAGKIKPRLTFQNLHLINRGTGCLLILCGGFLLYQTYFNAEKWKLAEKSYSLEQSAQCQLL